MVTLMNTFEPSPREGKSVRFFMHEDARHQGMALHEWLLALAKRESLAGGQVFPATVGT